MGGRGVDGNEHALGNWVLDDCTQYETNVFLSCLVCFVLLIAFLALQYLHLHCGIQ